MQRPQAVLNGGSLHAFGHHRESQVVREVDGGAHDHRVVLTGLHAHHKRFVDLEFIHRQALEVGQRRIPRAEIVDGQLEALL